MSYSSSLLCKRQNDGTFKTCEFVQIYWRDDQLPELYPFATPYKNLREGAELNYFENAVIYELVPQSTADLIGVASHKLKAKRNEGSTEGILNRKHGSTVLSPDSILRETFDVAILTPRNDLHDMLNAALGYHGVAWSSAFNFFNQNFLRQLGIRPPEFPDKLTHTIYENHFIARREIYQEYVKDCLGPAIAFMDQHPDVFLQPDGMNYINRKRAHERDEYRAKTGRQEFPIAPFVLERLFSIWIQRRNFKVVPL